MRNATRQARAALVAIFCSAAALPFPAAAGAAAGPAPGVHVDPGSPVAKEYAIPLGAARGNGTPGDPTTGQLFGAGITRAVRPGSGTRVPAAGSSSSTATTSTSTAPTSSSAQAVLRHRRSGRRLKHAGHRRAGAPTERPLTPQAAIGTSSSSGTGITWMLGVAILVLAVGGLGGAAIARRNRRTNPFPS